MRRLMFALVLIGGACAGTNTQPIDTSSTTNTTPTSVSTTVVSQAPDTASVRPFNDGRPTLMDPGVTYEYQGLPFPVRLTFEQSNWQSDFSSDALIALRTSTNDLARRVAANIGILETGGDLESVFREHFAEQFEREAEPETSISHQSSFTWTAPQETSVAGRDAIFVDVTVDTEPSPTNTAPPCDDVFDLGTPTIFIPGQDPRGMVGTMAGCSENRIWLTTVDDLIVVLHITHLDPQLEEQGTLEQLDPYVDEFIDAITFCTEATPCED